MADKNVNVELEFNSETKQAQQDLTALDNKLKAIEQSAKKSERAFMNMADVTQKTAAAGALLFAPAILSAQKYVETVGKAENISKRYTAAQERQTKATIDFGRKSAEALIPYQEALARILEIGSQLDPRLLQAGLALGGGLVLVGAIGTLTAQIGVFVAQSQKLVVALNTQIAGGGAAARLGVGLGAVAVGTGIGVGATRAIGKATGDERLEQYGLDDTMETLKQLLVIAIEGVGEFGKLLLNLHTVLELGRVKFEQAFEELVAGLKKGLLQFEAALTEIPGIGDALQELGIIDRDLVKAQLESLAVEEDRVKRLKALAEKAEAAGLTEDAAALRAEVDRLTGSFGQQALEIGQQNEETQRKIDELIGQLQVGVTEGLSGGRGEGAVGEGATDFTQESLDLFEQFQEDYKQAEKDFYSERKEKISDFEADMLKSEQDFLDNRQKQLKDFTQKQKDAERDFNRQRERDAAKFQKEQQQAVLDFNADQAQQQKDFDKETIERVKQFNKQREKEDRDSKLRLQEAAQRLDAIAVLRELQSAKQGKEEGKGEFDEQEAERRRAFEEQRNREREQFARQQGDRQRQFEESRKLALEEFRYRQDLERQRFNEQRQNALAEFRNSQAQRRQAFQQQLADEQRQHNREQAQRRLNFQRQLDQLNGWNQYEATARQRHYERLKADLNRYLLSFAPSRVGASTEQNRTTIHRSASGNVRRGVVEFQEGGYTGAGGMARLHPGEYVLSSATTRALERGLGALTQSKIQQTFNNRQNSMSNEWNIRGESAMDIAGQVRHVVENIFREELAT